MNSSSWGLLCLSRFSFRCWQACGGSSPRPRSKPLAERKSRWPPSGRGRAKEIRGGLKKFSDDTGATATFTSTGDQIGTVLGSRIASNSRRTRVLPQPGLLHDLAVKGSLKELDSARRTLSPELAPVWKDLGTVNGKFYGVWYKAANKSTVW